MKKVGVLPLVANSKPQGEAGEDDAPNCVQVVAPAPILVVTNMPVVVAMA